MLLIQKICAVFEANNENYNSKLFQHCSIMSYFNYHATAKRLIAEGKLTGYYYTEKHNNIRPALVLLFDDFTHPVMPIREERWSEYEPLLTEDKRI